MVIGMVETRLVSQGEITFEENADRFPLFQSEEIEPEPFGDPLIGWLAHGLTEPGFGPEVKDEVL